MRQFLTYRVYDGESRIGEFERRDDAVALAFESDLRRVVRSDNRTVIYTPPNRTLHRGRRHGTGPRRWESLEQALAFAARTDNQEARK